MNSAENTVSDAKYTFRMTIHNFGPIRWMFIGHGSSLVNKVVTTIGKSHQDARDDRDFCHLSRNGIFGTNWSAAVNARFDDSGCVVTIDLIKGLGRRFRAA